jgi:hypothetical protein
MATVSTSLVTTADVQGSVTVNLGGATGPPPDPADMNPCIQGVGSQFANYPIPPFAQSAVDPAQVAGEFITEVVLVFSAAQDTSLTQDAQAATMAVQQDASALQMCPARETAITGTAKEAATVTIHSGVTLAGWTGLEVTSVTMLTPPDDGFKGDISYSYFMSRPGGYLYPQIQIGWNNGSDSAANQAAANTLAGTLLARLPS